MFKHFNIEYRDSKMNEIEIIVALLNRMTGEKIEFTKVCGGEFLFTAIDSGVHAYGETLRQVIQNFICEYITFMSIHILPDIKGEYMYEEHQRQHYIDFLTGENSENFKNFPSKKRFT